MCKESLLPCFADRGTLSGRRTDGHEHQEGLEAHEQKRSETLIKTCDTVSHPKMGLLVLEEKNYIVV